MQAPGAARTAFVALGSNLDDPADHVLRAMDELAGLPGTRVVARSSLYRTAPLGKLDQPDFINAVVQISTELTPRGLLQELLAIEQRHARVRTELNAPRTLDLDLLLYGDEVIDQPGLHVPHPRMHERAFVLLPLAEIAPGAHIPGRGTAASLLPTVDRQLATRIDAHEIPLHRR
jgi:2-amino-4-hydroxy-6-hydroxymethyldihydropteridine diphosphokinase